MMETSLHHQVETMRRGHPPVVITGVFLSRRNRTRRRDASPHQPASARISPISPARTPTDMPTHHPRQPGGSRAGAGARVEAELRAPTTFLLKHNGLNEARLDRGRLHTALAVQILSLYTPYYQRRAYVYRSHKETERKTRSKGGAHLRPDKSRLPVRPPVKSTCQPVSLCCLSHVSHTVFRCLVSMANRTRAQLWHDFSLPSLRGKPLEREKKKGVGGGEKKNTNLSFWRK